MTARARFPAVANGPCLAVFATLAWAGCSSGQDLILARVGKLAIRESEFQKKLADVSPDYQNYILSSHGRRQFLDVLIREKMILAAAADAGIQRRSDFQSQWERLKADEAERLAAGKEYLMTQLWLEDLRKLGVLAVTDADVRGYYDRHPNECLVRHILLATAEEAEAVLAGLRSGKAAFANLAKQKSIDPETASKGGEMTPVLYGEVIPELEDVVFNSKMGETVGPVRSKFGYHILRKDAQRRVPWEKAQARILRVLEKRKLDGHLQSLESRYPVEVREGAHHGK